MEVTTVPGFIDYYGSVWRRTYVLVERIPPDLLERPLAPGRFTAGDQLRHLAAIERFMFAENAAGRPSRYPGHGRELADGYDDVVAYFVRMHEETKQVISALSDADLQKRCATPAGATITAWKWLRAMIEHHVHHRGQLYLTLGLFGIPTPPIFGLTSEEVKARSMEPLP